MSLWDFSIGNSRPIYDIALWYLRNAPVDWLKEYLRHGAAGHTSSPILFTNKDGITFDLDMGSFIERFIYCFHYYEPGDVVAVRRLLRSGDVVIDVGANVGQYALMAATAVGDNGAVYAFEPSPNILTKLRRNRKLNELTNLQIVPSAVGSKSEFGNFYPAEGYNEGIGSLVYQGGSDAGMRSETPIQVEVITLDDFCNNNAINRVDFIKIDAEGYDFEVLKGAEYTLQTNQDIVVMVEMVEQEADIYHLCVKIEHFMLSLGFLAFGSDNCSPFNAYVSGKLIPVESSLRTGPINVFFIRKVAAERFGLL
ncbi:MAG: FkbM family methyltransferase [Mariprofundales bacterium]|nr:FkbM family methyltransferase [Mariprofundales bacterium]